MSDVIPSATPQQCNTQSLTQFARLGQKPHHFGHRIADDDARRPTSPGHASGLSVEALFAEERARSHQYGGRSVYGAEPPPNQTVQRMGERTE
jgi:hypothetical protein